MQVHLDFFFLKYTTGIFPGAYMVHILYICYVCVYMSVCVYVCVCVWLYFILRQGCISFFEVSVSVCHISLSPQSKMKFMRLCLSLCSPVFCLWGLKCLRETYIRRLLLQNLDAPTSEILCFLYSIIYALLSSRKLSHFIISLGVKPLTMGSRRKYQGYT